MSIRKIKVVNTPHITRYGARSVNRLECAIEDILLERGYGRLEGSGADAAIVPWLYANPKLFKRGMHFGTSIAGKPRIADFIVSTVTRPILIEAKLQDSRGTAWEKIPYSIQDLQATGMDWMLVYDGNEIPEALMEHQRRVTKRDESCVGIFRLADLVGFLHSIDPEPDIW